MKFTSAIITLIVLGAIYYFVSPQIPLHIGVKNLSPIQGFGSNLRLTVTLNNFTAQKKTLDLTSSDILASSLLYIDHAEAPAADSSLIVEPLATLDIPAFSRQEFTIEMQLNEGSGDKKPQILRGDAKRLTLAGGEHSYMVSIGGNISGKQHFTVQ